MEPTTSEAGSRPAVLNVLYAGSFLFGLLFTALGVAGLVTGFGAIAVFFGALPGAMMMAGTVGMITRREWGRRILDGGLIIGGMCAGVATLFGFLATEGGPDLATMLTWAALVASVIMFGMLFAFHSAAVSPYLWTERLSEMASAPADLDEVVLDFVASPQAESEEDEVVSTSRDVRG